MKLQIRNRRSVARPARAAKSAAHAPLGAESADHNRAAVAEALGHTVQSRLTVGRADDPQEGQADRVAAQVMAGGAVRGIGSGGESVQRMCAGCEEEQEHEKVRRAAADNDIEADAEERRKKLPPEAEPVQRQPETGGGAPAGGVVPGVTAARIRSRRGAGAPLPGRERAFFEPRFGGSFAHVRVHADGESAWLARELNARAFTVGRDVFFGAGEYRPGTVAGRHLLAHELTHVVQQAGAPGGVIRRWDVGAAPAPAGWEVVTDPAHLRRLNEAEDIVRALLTRRRCQNFFRDNCEPGFGADPLDAVFDNTDVYLIPNDDNLFGESDRAAMQMAFNLRAFRIGKWFMASTLLHEMMHCCTPASAIDRAGELRSENAVETCRLYTPWVNTVSPRAGSVGSRVTIRGWNLGPTRGPADAVRIGGVNASIISWTFDAGTVSTVTIVAEVPAGAGAGGVVVVNNTVESNVGRFTVT
jgi:hypothetical protein